MSWAANVGRCWNSLVKGWDFIRFVHDEWALLWRPLPFDIRLSSVVKQWQFKFGLSLISSSLHRRTNISPSRGIFSNRWFPISLITFSTPRYLHFLFRFRRFSSELFAFVVCPSSANQTEVLPFYLHACVSTTSRWPSQGPAFGRYSVFVSEIVDETAWDNIEWIRVTKLKWSKMNGEQTTEYP